MQAIQLANRKDHPDQKFTASRPPSSNAAPLTIELPVRDDVVELELVGIRGVKIVHKHHFNDVYKLVPILFLNRGCNLMQVGRGARYEVQ
eukprot:1143672-Pelagomonas_calceolata.AAC.10